MAQSAGAVEYTDCISAEGYNSFNECPNYDPKQSDGEAPVNLELWEMQRYSFIAIAPGSTLAWRGAPDTVLSLSQIEPNCNYAKLNCLKLTVLTFNCV